MSDKDAIKLLQEKVKKALGWQAKVKEVAESAVTEVTERQEQERR